ncbi:unnamed protein product [Brachionus calyciflorus]|uniref:Ig-like domain-containing protein n=1 Tax=Brachionus calyciflorus TaxID=104777 RepID=A0A813X3A8_9BILA|nr:unnamed protein product [Brachionus calyciflorus]
MFIPSKLEITQKYSINAVETESIKLNCQIGDLTEKFDSIIWTLNNEKLEPDNPNLIINQDSNLLVIKEAKLTDTGLYTCTAQSNSSIYSTKINLNINKKQIKTTQIESKTKLIKASVNQSISLDCAWWFTNSENLFDSSLEYTIEWKLNSTKIDVENNSKKFEFLDNFKTLLQVKNIQLTEAHDIYSCSLKMFDNSERQSVFRLSVGMVPYMKNSNSNYNQISKWFYKFDSVILECPLVGYPEPTITWLQDSNELNSQLRQFKIDGNSLTIFQLDDLQQGVYSCNATNDFGSNKIDFSIGIARPIRVKDLTEKSIKVNKNDMVHMKCDYSSGSPEPNISWFFNDTKIDTLDQKYSIESNKLLIKKASENNNGVFKCILSNGFFEDKSLLFNLKVQERVVIRFYPENPVFLVGKEGRITCVIDNGAVSSELIWLKNDAPLKIGQKYQTDKNDLIIKNVKTSDSGKYSCSVNYNGEEKVTKSVDVKVIDKSIKIECEDKSSYNNCKLVVSRGLCGKFAKYCCKTCKQAGFTVKQN